ncbi:MAG: hypothetical protein ACI8Z1_000566 [Candidatus Azotimanducaceae bacterium]|jgi:hypothetical protein
MSWGLGGWLLTPFIGKAGILRFMELLQRIADEMTSTFASSYTQVVSLSEALSAPSINVYAKRTTGEKALSNPNK